MTTKQLTNEIKKAQDRLSKRNLKSGEASELHLRIDTLRVIKSQLEKLEIQLDSLNNR
jgi:hypothetical protein